MWAAVTLVAGALATRSRKSVRPSTSRPQASQTLDLGEICRTVTTEGGFEAAAKQLQPVRFSDKSLMVQTYMASLYKELVILRDNPQASVDCSDWPANLLPMSPYTSKSSLSVDGPQRPRQFKHEFVFEDSEHVEPLREELAKRKLKSLNSFTATLANSLDLTEKVLNLLSDSLKPFVLEWVNTEMPDDQGVVHVNLSVKKPGARPAGTVPRRKHSLGNPFAAPSFDPVAHRSNVRALDRSQSAQDLRRTAREITGTTGSPKRSSASSISTRGSSVALPEIGADNSETARTSRSQKPIYSNARDLLLGRLGLEAHADDTAVKQAISGIKFDVKNPRQCENLDALENYAESVEAAAVLLENPELETLDNVGIQVPTLYRAKGQYRRVDLENQLTDMLNLEGKDYFRFNSDGLQLDLYPYDWSEAFLSNIKKRATAQILCPAIDTLTGIVIARLSDKITRPYTSEFIALWAILGRMKFHEKIRDVLPKSGEPDYYPIKFNIDERTIPLTKAVVHLSRLGGSSSLNEARSRHPLAIRRTGSLQQLPLRKREPTDLNASDPQTTQKRSSGRIDPITSSRSSGRSSHQALRPSTDVMTYLFNRLRAPVDSSNEEIEDAVKRFSVFQEIGDPFNNLPSYCTSVHYLEHFAGVMEAAAIILEQGGVQTKDDLGVFEPLLHKRNQDAVEIIEEMIDGKLGFQRGSDYEKFVANKELNETSEALCGSVDEMITAVQKKNLSKQYYTSKFLVFWTILGRLKHHQRIIVNRQAELDFVRGKTLQRHVPVLL